MTKRSRWSTRKDNENNLFSKLPLDVKIEILQRLPAKTIVRLTFLSKYWLSVIHSKEFTNLYITRSLTQPRLLFVFNKENALLLDSCSQEDLSSDHQRVRIASHPDDSIKAYDFSAPVRGLICHQNTTKVMIGNPSTGQFITLPRVKTTRRNLFSFLGYDPVNDLYKVLCMTTVLQDAYQRYEFLDVSDIEHQVFTLGPKQKWRKIACKHPHLPLSYTKRICINGVVYYYARIKSEGSLICFDLTSENFSVVKLPMDIKGLVNYGGKIALYCHTYGHRLDLWVLQDARKQEWSEISHLIPLRDLVGFSALNFEGTLSTGQLIFSPLSYNSHSPYFLISYDLKENNAKKVMIEGIKHGSFIQFYFDHVECPILLSNVS